MKLKSESKITPRFLADGVGEIWLPKIAMGKEDVKFLRGCEILAQYGL